MWLDLPLYAVQRTPTGLWLVRALSEEPCSPGVAVVAVIDEADSKFQLGDELDDRDDIPEWLKDLARRYG